MHAIILAGGFGTRLRSVVSDVPKPLAPIAGRPFLAWLIDSLAAQGVTSVTLSVHHEWEKIRDYFAVHPARIPLDYAVEDKPLGTGGAIAFALKNTPKNERVLVLNGDTFVTLDYQKLYAHGTGLTLALREVTDTGRYGEVVVTDGIIREFASGSAGKRGFINAGVYVVPPDIFAPYDMPEAFSFERDFMPHHLAELTPLAFMAEDYFIDIGIPEDYARACEELPRLIALA